MENQDLDLDEYFTKIVKIGKDINSIYLTEGKKEQLAIICYELLKREILRGITPVLTKWRGYFEKIQKDLPRIERVKDRFDFENSKEIRKVTDKKIVDYFFPTEIEIETIKELRKGAFDSDKEDMEVFDMLKCKPQKIVIQEKINDISYCYSRFYEIGEPIQIRALNCPRVEVVMNFGLDLGRYDFIQHLKNKLLETEKPSLKNVSELTVKQCMLHYVYRQECKEYPRFIETTKSEIKKISLEVGKSENTLYQAYFEVNNYNVRKLLNRKDIESVIISLEDYPKAQNLAKDELKLIELNS